MATDHPTTQVEYRDVQGFPGYRVGDDGSVWSRFNRQGRPKPYWIKKKPALCEGYPKVCLRRNGKSHFRYVHRLVLEAFIGPCPPGMEACHFPDIDRTNVRLSNLRWDTRKANCADSFIHGNDRRGSKNPLAKLTESQVREIRRLHAEGMNYCAIARMFGVNRMAIKSIVKFKNWAHIT